MTHVAPFTCAPTPIDCSLKHLTFVLFCALLPPRPPVDSPFRQTCRAREETRLRSFTLRRP